MRNKMVIWIATKGKKETVFRKCPEAKKRLTYDNVMPYVEKTALNLTRLELKEANEEIKRLKVKYKYVSEILEKAYESARINPGLNSTKILYDGIIKITGEKK